MAAAASPALSLAESALAMLTPDAGYEAGGSTIESRSARRRLKQAGDAARKSVQFVRRGAEAVTQRKVSTTVASFLPSSLLDILERAVVDDTINPRIPMERPGVYLCLSLGGLHGMAELPMMPEEFEKKLKDVFHSIATCVQSCHGELVRMTGDMALAVWELPPPNDEIPEGSGSRTTQASVFPERDIKEAVQQASICGQRVLEELHETVLWMDTSPESIARMRSQRRNVVADSPDSTDPKSPAMARKTKPSLWSNARALSSKATAPVKLGTGQPSGLSMLQAVKAASAAAEQGLAFKLEVGASLTVALAQAMHVGGANGRWEYVLCAPEISAGLHVLTQVDPGELLVAESLWSTMPPTDLQPHLMIDDWKRLPVGVLKGQPDREDAMEHRLSMIEAVPVAAVKSYMPGAVWAKILAGSADWIVGQGEWRTVSVLMIRMFAPRNVALVTQVAAYTAAVSGFQNALYKGQGTFKHMVQDEHGCSAVACFGLPPFQYSEVVDSRGAVTAALQMRSDLKAMGINAHAVIVTGKVWVGSVGAEYRREYAIVGQPLQLARQMLGFTTDDQPVLVDAITSQANKTRFNFTTMSVTIRVPGQLKQHAMLAVSEPRKSEKEKMAATKNVAFPIAQWLRSHSNGHHKHLSVNLTTDLISDSAKQQMLEVFTELDSDASGKISVTELLDAIGEIDVAEASDPKSLRYNVELIMSEMDAGIGGEIAFEEFLAMAAAANERSMSQHDEDNNLSMTQNLPMLLTAHTTRKLLQRRLGEEFVQSYEQGKASPTKSSRSPSPLESAQREDTPARRHRHETMLGLMLEGDDAIDFPFFVQLVKVAEPSKFKKGNDKEVEQLFDSFEKENKDGVDRIDRRTYLRSVMFERMATSSSRAVELFLRMDVNKDGHVSLEEFHQGLQSLRLGPDNGFTKADGDALFEALDEDGSGTLEYVEIATSLRAGRHRVKTLDRLKRRKRRVSVSPPRMSVLGRRQSTAARRMSTAAPVSGPGRRVSAANFGARPDEGSWKRADRRRSINAVIDGAQAKADEETTREVEVVGAQTRALQNLSDETEAIYAQFRAMRNKMGPVKDPLGRLDALLSPRVTADHFKARTSLRHIPLRAEDARLSSPPRDGRSTPLAQQRRYSASPPSSGAARPRPISIPADASSTASPPPLQSTPSSVGHRSLRRQLAVRIPDLILPKDVQATEQSSPGQPTPAESGANPSPSLSALPSTPRAPPPTENSMLSVAAREELRRHITSLAPGIIGSRRFQPFSGPSLEAEPKPEVQRSFSARAEPPPSTLLPPIPPTPQHTGSSSLDASHPSFHARWGASDDGAEAERRNLKRQGATQRDHHSHMSMRRQASSWQCKLRHKYRMRLLAGETESAAQASQLTRLHAFQCLRDAYTEGDSPIIQKELELGVFSGMGMSVGSRPRTPADEHAMSGWVIDGQGMSAQDVQMLSQAKSGPNKRPDEMNKEELLAWLREPSVRTNFDAVSDILEFHGVLNEFAPPAPIRTGSSTSPSPRQSRSASPTALPVAQSAAKEGSSRRSSRNPSPSPRPRGTSRNTSQNASHNASRSVSRTTSKNVSPVAPRRSGDAPPGVRNARKRAHGI